MCKGSGREFYMSYGSPATDHAFSRSLLNPRETAIASRQNSQGPRPSRKLKRRRLLGSNLTPVAVSAVMRGSRASYLRLVAVRHPPSEQLNAIQRPGAFPSWWRRRHDSATDAANTIIDDGRMRLYIIVAREVECLTHRPNVSLGKEWANVRLIARVFCHVRHLVGMIP